MFDFDETLLYSIAFYLASCYFLYQLKHPKMFDEQGNFKCFGLNQHETVFPYWLVTTMIGLISYYVLVVRKKSMYFFD